MVTVVPYVPSLRWYAYWFGCRCRGMSEDEARMYANRECRICGKDFARMLIPSVSGPMLLSVAVEGGASKLKRTGSEGRVLLSLHGNWPHVHLGAIDAVYGRTPYYQHIIPGLREILDTLPGRLKDLNNRMHIWLTSFLQPDPDINIEKAVLQRGLEISRHLDPDMSVIDALMRFGPETNLVLIHYSETSDYATTCSPLAASAGSPDRESDGECPSACAQAESVAGSA